MKAIVIGAGLGGLAISCLLASKGHKVTVFEKNGQPGGKMNQLKRDGFRFDTGPSLLTMPFILEKLFSTCGQSLNDYLELAPVDPICRYNYKDGTRFDCYHSIEKNLEQLREFAPNDLHSFNRFLTYSEELYERTKNAFLFNPLYGLSDLASLNISDFLQIDAFTSISDRVDSCFQSPHLQQFFKRFATYNGSSPLLAPATLNVIPHVELSLGGYYVKGGMYKIIEALADLAIPAGVQFSFNTEIKAIEFSGRQATGVISSDNSAFAADIIVSNCDATETYTGLIPDDTILKQQSHLTSLEPSCSGFVLMLGIDQTYKQLQHHNIFFSGDYDSEFYQIFEQKVMPEDPTIYIANTSYSDPAHAPEGGSNLFILVNAPYLTDSWKWKGREAAYGDFIIDQLEKRGLTNLRGSIRFRKHITPPDFYELYRSNRGSIYGTSSNSRLAAFLRPRNKSRNADGLYLVGGSTHPGGGIPLVILSAFHAAALIDRYES